MSKSAPEERLFLNRHRDRLLNRCLSLTRRFVPGRHSDFANVLIVTHSSLARPSFERFGNMEL